MVSEVRDMTIDLGDEVVRMRYRPGTRDRATLEDNWVKHPYRLSRHLEVTRRNFIDETYAGMIAAGVAPLIVDAGANIGASALVLARYYPEATILALEPEPENFEILRANTRANPMIRCFQAALASADGEVQLTDPGRSTDAYRTGPAAEGDRMGAVQAMSMHTVLELTRAKPLLAKIDIEGGEADLFAANTDWVDLFPALAIELHDWMLPGQASSASFLACVAARRRDFINPAESDIVFSLRN